MHGAIFRCISELVVPFIISIVISTFNISS